MLFIKFYKTLFIIFIKFYKRYQNTLRFIAYINASLLNFIKNKSLISILHYVTFVDVVILKTVCCIQ